MTIAAYTMGVAKPFMTEYGDATPNEKFIARLVTSGFGELVTLKNVMARESKVPVERYQLFLGVMLCELVGAAMANAAVRGLEFSPDEFGKYAARLAKECADLSSADIRKAAEAAGIKFT